MAYIDVPTSTDLVRNGMKVLTVVSATCNKTFQGAGVFTIESGGAYRIASSGIGSAFATGDWIVVRESVSTAASTKNNDGIYEIEDGDSHSDWIEVVKPVAPMTWKTYDDAAAIDVDEIDTFILHPTKRIEQICVFVINSASTVVQVCFAPGPFWAASLKGGIPQIQGSPSATASYLFQVETAKFLQTEKETLVASINRRGSILMHVMPAVGVNGTTVDVGLIQRY